MATTGPESNPTTWTDQDTAFFHITASPFPGDFTYGARVLLASYDDERLPVVWIGKRTDTSAFAG